jgi:hypothetical protein
MIKTNGPMNETEQAIIAKLDTLIWAGIAAAEQTPGEDTYPCDIAVDAMIDAQQALLGNPPSEPLPGIWQAWLIRRGFRHPNSSSGPREGGIPEGIDDSLSSPPPTTGQLKPVRGAGWGW